MAPYQRLRVTYRDTRCSEPGANHLGRTWVEAFEGAGLRLARPEGSRRARIETGPPLPQGATGEAELVDGLLAAPVAPADAIARLATTLPDGLDPLSAEEIGERLPSLGASVRAACYRATFGAERAGRELEQRVAALLALPALEWEEQRGERLRRLDLRALLYDLRACEGGSMATVEMRVALSQEGSVRPASVLAALGLEGPSQLVRTAIEVERPLIAIRAWRERGRFE